ncbi:DgyrCDS6051 [Dimorphilus gyrociliatus]|uniref:Macoilin n=1 Tax=Dimorphilus gyrociliatus TaxID=2664684 RepID=A0A7I8VRP0_9ANNE|nr:DgyrCDS6051 [Dimorphilus gyrociliatus]
MKRRNAECGKLRRPLKKSKITEGIYGSTLLYVKFLLVWSFVLMADYIIQFRFEYLWPFWLLLRSVHDSFKYQGLAFSVLFVCIAITSDVICYLFIPVQWLFFAASTYVWIQYVWHTDRGLCLSTASLWIIFVYFEASFRLREVNVRHIPFHLDLCRPFAAHCIGYPVVTLGFGFKSYVSYKLRLRKQKDVQKENEFFFELLQQALPAEQQALIEKQKAAAAAALLTNNKEEVISNVTPSTPQTRKALATTDATFIEQRDYSDKKKSLNDYEEENAVNEAKSLKSSKTNNKLNSNSSSSATTPSSSNSSAYSRGSSKGKSPPSKDNKDEYISRLENDHRQLRSDIQRLRSIEAELRSKLLEISSSEKQYKAEADQLRHDNDSLQTRLHHLVTSRQQDKVTINGLQTKLSEVSKQKQSVEAKAAQQKSECNNDSCRQKKKELDQDLKIAKKDLKLKEEHVKQLEQDIQLLQLYKEQQSQSEDLASKINSLTQTNSILQDTLRSETRVKLDLYSAMEGKQREIKTLNDDIIQRNRLISKLESRMAEVMALAPAATPVTSSWPSAIPASTLNPRASDYMPE